MSKTIPAKCRVRRILKKYELVELAGGACIKCGYDKNIASMVFHHIDEKNIALNGSNMTKRSEDLKAEARQCALLCHNCHSELHSPQLNIDNVRQAFIANKENKLTKAMVAEIFFKGDTSEI